MKNLKVLLIALILMTACEKEEVVPQNPLEGWEGEYFTQTRFWGTYFSPIVVTDEGSLLVAGTVVAYEFDEMSNTLSFDWTSIKNTEAKASFSFEEHGENKMLSGSLNPRRQDGGVSLRGGIIPYTVWSGTYQTETQWWGGYFSPLDIDKDGSVTIADEGVEVTFNEETLELSFDWTNIKTTTAKAAFTFSGDYPKYVFSGSINPRRQDGPVGFSGE